MSVNSVYARGWVPHTCIAMSSSIRITSMDAATGSKRQIGLIQTFRPTDTRRQERARGVGYGDRVAEIIPAFTDTTITCSRICLYECNILQTFGYHTRYGQKNNKGSVRSLSHLKNPFDIEEIIWFHAPGEVASQTGYGVNSTGQTSGSGVGYEKSNTNHTVTIYHDCWINNWTRAIEITGNLMLMEDVTIDVTWVSDGIEPDPYESMRGSEGKGITDVWGTHGLGCQSSDVKMGTASKFAANSDNATFWGGVVEGSGATAYAQQIIG